VPAESNRNIFVGTVGYAILSNHSIGPILLPHLKKMDWPNGVSVDELNWGPIAVVQQFEALEIAYDRVVLLVAIERSHRKIGEINIFQWKGELPDEKQIQACIGDAATGVISVENLLVIGEYFKTWPKEVFLVDVEPGPEVAGENLTTEVAENVPDILKLVQHLAVEGTDDTDLVDILRGNELFNEELNV
jgi:hypothetical protein